MASPVELKVIYDLMQKMKAENASLKAENDSLKAENDSLKAENDSLKVENDSLKVENRTKQDLIAELRSDLSLAKVDIESYKKVDVANRKQIDELQAQVEQNEADQNQVYNKLMKDNDKYVAEICASRDESYNSLKSVSHAKLSATQEELSATKKELAKTKKDLAAYIRSCVAADNL